MPLAAYAQDEGAGDPAGSEGAAAEGASEVADSAAAEADPAPAQKFPIKRGFFVETDLGIFFTFAGRNTNDPVNLPKRLYSNVQPFLGVTLAYDIAHSDAFSFAVGLKLGAGYSSGAGRISDREIQAAGNNLAALATRPNDFSILQAGVVAAVAIPATDRLWITGKVDGGLGVAQPNPNHIAEDASTPLTAIGAVVGFGLGAEFFTLLNDFSVGLDLRFVLALVGDPIPGLSVTAPIKYTF